MTADGIVWRVRHRAVTESTNKDALNGAPGDVFTADFQTAGRGRLDHHWLSPPGENLMMSVVIDVEGMSPEEVSTVPLAIGLAVVQAVVELLCDGVRFCNGLDVRLKWPNDVLVNGCKVCGILCERNGDNVIAGIGMNVNQTVFAPEIAARASSLRWMLRCPTSEHHAADGCPPPFSISEVRDTVLKQFNAVLGTWRRHGFKAIWPMIATHDFLKGKRVSVCQTDHDKAPVTGLCGGIRADGALLVGDEAVFAGESHLLP